MYLIRIDVNRNMARFYRLQVLADLFGGWSLVREYGRIGRPGTVRVEGYPTRGQADIALISLWSKKLRKGYR